MSELTDHINQGNWLEYFEDHERGHVLNFIYNLLKWLVRDQADELVVTPAAFTWCKGKTTVGTFPITTPEPTPTFKDSLLHVVRRDKTVAKCLRLITEDAEVSRFEFRV